MFSRLARSFAPQTSRLLLPRFYVLPAPLKNWKMSSIREEVYKAENDPVKLQVLLSRVYGRSEPYTDV